MIHVFHLANQNTFYDTKVSDWPTWVTLLICIQWLCIVCHHVKPLRDFSSVKAVNLVANKKSFDRVTDHGASCVESLMIPLTLKIPNWTGICWDNKIIWSVLFSREELPTHCKQNVKSEPSSCTLQKCIPNCVVVLWGITVFLNDTSDLVVSASFHSLRVVILTI